MTGVLQLPMKIPPDLVQDVLARLHYSSADLETFHLDATTGHLQYTHRGRESPADVERKMLKVIHKMISGFQRRRTKTLVDRRSTPTRYAADPVPELERRGEMQKVGLGQYALGPRLSKLAAYFEEEFTGIAGTLKADAYRFPTLIGVRALSRCDYFTSFPQSVSFVMHLSADVDVIEAFAATMGTESSAVPPSSAHFATGEYVLSPAVCFHLYARLADRPLAAQPVIVTAVGKCFRYEAGNLGGLERLWDFSMREIIFVGSRDRVLSLRQQSMDLFVDFLDRLELKYWIETATDPFFIGDYSARSAFQSAMELKYEIRLDIPFKNSSIAAGSFNHHQNFFGKAFQIGQPGSDDWADTGCTAMGIERWVFGFLAQYGPEPAGWPPAVRQWIERA